MIDYWSNFIPFSNFLFVPTMDAGDEMTRVIWQSIKDKVNFYFLCCVHLSFHDTLLHRCYHAVLDFSYMYFISSFSPSWSWILSTLILVFLTVMQLVIKSPLKVQKQL